MKESKEVTNGSNKVALIVIIGLAITVIIVIFGLMYISDTLEPFLDWLFSIGLYEAIT